MSNLEEIKKVLQDKKYVFFENGDYNLNLVAVREDDEFDNAFSDTFYCFWKEKGEWKEMRLPWTTMPGTVGGVLDPITVLGITGTAVLKEGQYRSSWQFIDTWDNWIGAPYLHQVKDVTVYRDGNRDYHFDRDMPQQTGLFYINIHTMGNGYEVNNWSIGCQGTGWADFKKLIELLRVSTSLYGPRFTYTLLHRNDFQQTEKLKKVA